jgi:glucosamine 6-phosphate synthetase-like amidotransferase/phosphosugar isomerase protein
MCGITGYITTKPNTAGEAKEILKKLLVSSSQRGTDATGISFVKDNRIVILKDDKPADKFILSNKYRELMAENNPEILIAHTRAATKGNAKDNNNNHPIQAGSLAMAHNGIISNDDEVFKNFRLNRAGEVDSEAIIAIIAHYKKKTLTTREAIQKGIKQIRGSMALAIINADNERELHLVRAGNPIAVAYHKPTGIIYFASTDEIIKNSIAKHKFYFDFFIETLTNKKDYVINELNDDTGYRLTAEKITGYKVETKPYSSYNNYSKWNGYNWTDDDKEKTAKIPVYNKIYDFKQPVKKPSKITSEDLEKRLEILHELTQNYTATQKELTETKRIENCLLDRAIKENETDESKKKDDCIVTNSTQNYLQRNYLE